MASVPEALNGLWGTPGSTRNSSPARTIIVSPSTSNDTSPLATMNRSANVVWTWAGVSKPLEDTHQLVVSELKRGGRQKQHPVEGVSHGPVAGAQHGRFG